MPEDPMSLQMLVCQLILLVLAGVFYSNEANSSENWQMTRLFHPSEANLASENKGRIIIYSGLTDKTVDKALDENFDRINAMMFTKTIKTDEAGNPLRDPETGEVMTEDDGCD